MTIHQKNAVCFLMSMMLVSASGCGEQGDVGTSAGALGTVTTVDDFAGGVSAANHPDPANAAGVWYDAAHNTFGTPSAATVESTTGPRPGMRIDDGGFTNGVYAIYAGAVPATGDYTVRAEVHVVESGGGTDGVRAFQMGVTAGASAVHRGPNPSAVPGLAVTASYAGLTPADDTGAGPQVIETGELHAEAGDDLLVAFGTDVTSGGWNGSSGFWSGAYVTVTTIELVAADPTTVVDDDDGPPGFVENSPAWSVSGGIGYAGGHYRFTSTGSTRAAIWTATGLEAGAWDVQVFYRAGTNRATAAHYTLESGGASSTHRVNQQLADAAWVEIGQVIVGVDGTASVTLDAELSAPLGKVVIADAVRFVPGVAPVANDPEMRVGVATVFDTFDDVGAIQSMVDDMALARYNAIAVHARFRGDATYVPNRTDTTYPNPEPRSDAVGDVDALAAFVEAGHARGLKVFAYVNTHLVTEGADEPSDPGHVVNAHPDWRTWAYGGGTPHPQTTADDGEGLWLEPGLPEVRSYLQDIVGDIASNYDVDGVILDRIRYPQTGFTRANRDFGYHPDAVRAFNRAYRKRGTPDPNDPDWIDFRQAQITETVGAIYERLESIDPQLLLLAYPIGRFTDATEFNYQDWPEWLRGRHIDGVLPQIYTDDDAAFAARLSTQLDAYEGDRMVGVTIDAFRAGVNVAGQLETCRALGAAGASPFRHGSLVALGEVGQLREAWTGPAAFPATPWKGAPIERLDVKSTCEPTATGEVRWQITNPNPWAIEIGWRLLGRDHTVTHLFVEPGESVLETPAGRRHSVLLMSWYEEHGRLRADVALDHPIACRRR